MSTQANSSDVNSSTPPNQNAPTHDKSKRASSLPAPKKPDTDPEETQEWIESFAEVIDNIGSERAEFLLDELTKYGKSQGINSSNFNTDYVNSIHHTQESAYPGDKTVEEKYGAWIRWNAAIMVHRAQKDGVGGHISTYAGAATLYEVGFNHFFKGKDHPSGGDQIFFQGHASPGMYSRAFLEGRLTENDLDGFRQQASHSPHGLPSYPHPRQMPHFWEFPTVSMGIGPMNAIFQAQNNRYLENRGVKDTKDQHVWAFLGDGEMDEPESRGLLQVATNDKLDNLTFVINANMQRLDGPVRGNGKIVQELDSFFQGAGWNVIKVLWGSQWDALLDNDSNGKLVDIMNNTPDGDFQTYKGESGKYVRENFFGKTPETANLVKDLSDDEIWNLQRGGHDYQKVYSAYKQATEIKNGKPTVILVQTVKGHGLGPNFEARNATHQMKKLTADDLKRFRDHLEIPITDEQIDADPYNVPYFHPGLDSPEIQYMLERRKELGGFSPERRNDPVSLTLPSDKAYEVAKKGSGNQEAATTMAFVRLLKELIREKGFGERIVPIVPDEARTFGMDSFFPSAKIYNPNGQQYTGVDRDLLLSYKESEKGQIIHPGINEAGSVAAFTSAGTSYATQGEVLVPFYIFYSMFGFQRTADYIWAASDQMARGFLIGATAGRTTLTGEGLQHNDGQSPLLASTNPAVITYDPAYGYEIAHIIRDGLERMYGPNSLDRDLIYYLTVYNEPIVQPAEPENLDIEGLLGGIYRVNSSPVQGPKAQILASGVAVPWAMEAQQLLAQDWGVSADIWSVTSWTELRRDGLAAEEDAFLNPGLGARTPFVTSQLANAQGPVIAVSDYMKAVPDQIRQFVPNEFAALGADDFGFSDTRAAARRYFKIDGPSVVVRTLEMLARRGEVDWRAPSMAIEKYDLYNVNAGTTGNAGGEA